jgi:hypothetical protein
VIITKKMVGRTDGFRSQREYEQCPTIADGKGDDHMRGKEMTIDLLFFTADGKGPAAAAVVVAGCDSKRRMTAGR